MLRNIIVRKIVNSLIGNNAVVEITEVGDEATIELIDLRRRLPFGKWKIVSEESRWFKGQVSSVTSLTISKE
jgi:hypothetical protein